MLKRQNTSKYYENDISAKFCFAFLSLLTAPIVKKSHTSAGNYVMFLKNVLKQTWKSFNTKLWPQWKDIKSREQLKQTLALFWSLVAQSLD